MIFGNGPMPIGGYRVLAPGDSYQFSKAMPIATYFSRFGQHRVSWKGDAFKSNVLVVFVPTTHAETR
jgi:hypothetical protein